MVPDCYPCAREREFPELPQRELIAYDDHWRVAHATSAGIAGWLVLVPRRHVMEVHELTGAEARCLGTWQATLAEALNDELGVAKTYVASFGEAPGFHLHFHLIPRPAELNPEHLGPHVFRLLGTGKDAQLPAEEYDAVSKRISARLAA